AFGADGNLLIVYANDGLEARRFGRNGELLAAPTLLLDSNAGLVAPDASGFTLLSADGQTLRLGLTGAPVGDPVDLGDVFGLGLASDHGSGKAVAVGTVFEQAGTPNGVVAYRLSQGQPIGERIVVSPGGQLPGVAMDAAGGFVVAWISGSKVFGQRYDASGAPLGRSFAVGPFGPPPFERPVAPVIAAAPDGRFAVAWTFQIGLYLRLFAADGTPKTGPLMVTYDPDAIFAHLSLAVDPAGELLVGWDTSIFDGSELRGRFYDAAGRPAGRGFLLARAPFDYDFFDGLSVAAGAQGEFAAAWALTAEAGNHSRIFGRRLLWARSTDAPCLYAAGTFACDLRHDGGAPEIAYPFGGQPGDVPLLGDVDGDGRDDLCIYRRQHFLCDTARNGTVALDVPFGAAGDVPLLGDVDGDGRADLCVRRGNRFLCDTAHNGGTAEVVMTFGRPGDPALLGDVDGDGSADACVVENGQLLCDVAHGGRSPGLVLPFNGDVPLLGDVDGDGRADPCLYRPGRTAHFLCDTAHDGRFRTVIPSGASPGATPLFGNLEGL
ncbi:MAG TPA: hypothetical protein VLX28_22545, partial [Thermoanaerobaculia bacterium]|nr:hypothetical protein [Thermoanaerobaculia bacterium]